MRVLEHKVDLGALHMQDPTDGLGVLPEYIGSDCRPEIALFCALLSSAADDIRMQGYVKDGLTREERRANALAWVLDDESDDIVSFLRCCRLTGIDPDAYRERLLGRAEQNAAA